MSNLLTLIKQNALPILEKTVHQSYLALSAIFIAILISVPLGILIAKRPRLQRYVLGFNSIFQTLPSLAVLGLLLPVFGIGVKTSLIALVLYALLPIIRNTVVGILNISPDLIEAANGLGLTRWQRVTRVELPLAVPVIVAGIRTATAMVIGISTLAALIGAGGLGEYIYEGLSLNNVNLILMGAIPAAFLALFFDFLIGRVEKLLTMKRRHRTKSRSQYFLRYTSCAIVLITFVYFFITPVTSQEHNEVRVGSKNFSEQLILGELIAQLLEAKTNLNVTRTFNLGGTFICHQAIVKNEIDIYPEYTGTSYLVILNKFGLDDPREIFKYVSQSYEKKFNLIWLGEFGFNNSNALAITQELSEKYNIKTIEQLVAIAQTLTIGVPADFMDRPDGFVGLKNRYGLVFGKVRFMDTGLMYKAVMHHQLDAIMAFSTDSRLHAYNLVPLTDNKHLFPPYYAAPVVSKKILTEHPEIVRVLKPLKGKIDNNVMRELNYQVDVKQRSPKEVAREFLKKQNMIK